MTIITEAVFPMAGLGTRLFPATKTCPKEMLPLGGKPLLHYVIEEALSSGIEKFIFIIRKENDSIQTYFREHQGLIPLKSIHYAYQEKPLGLGHAIACAQQYIKNKFFAVLLPDELISSRTPCLRQMINIQKEKSANILAINPMPLNQISQYGVIEGQKTENPTVLKLTDLIEKPSPNNAPSPFAIVGRYILSSRIFSYLKVQEPGVKGEIQLTDSLCSLLKDENFYGLEFEGERFDCGSKMGYSSAIRMFAPK